jgi:hypothetical protein
MLPVFLILAAAIVLAVPAAYLYVGILLAIKPALDWLRRMVEPNVASHPQPPVPRSSGI